MADQQTKSPLRKFLPLAILVAGLAVFFVFGRDYFSFEVLSENYGFIKDWVDDRRFIAWVVFFALYFVATAFSLPIASLLTLGGGAILGFVAAPLVISSATLGAFVLFLAARGAFAETMTARAGPFMARIKQGFDDSPFLWLLTLRLIPAFPFWLVNIAPALLGMKSRDYLLATAIGIAPGSCIYIWIGRDTVNSILAAGNVPNLDEIITLQTIAPLIALAVLSLIPIIFKRLKRK